MSLSSPDYLEAALAEVDRVAKRQKTCAAKTSGVLYKLIHILEKTLDKLSESCNHGVDVEVELNALRDNLMALEPVATLSSNTKELHGAVARLGKIIDKEFSVDINGALPDISMDLAALDTAVSEHLYREGLFEIGDVFAQEAHLDEDEVQSFKSQYELLYNLMKDLEERKLDSALTWVQSHRNGVRNRSHVGSSLQDLEFSVHSLTFLQVLERGNSKKEALQYARQNFPAFVDTHLMEVQELMGLLCSTVKRGNKLEYKSYYARFFHDVYWTVFSDMLKEHIFDLMNKSQKSPLSIAVAAGAAALPTLAKLASIVAKTQPASELAGEGQLPMEVPLGPEFVFHSIFACPVSREQSSTENPPMMLPCGHCICKQSVIRIAKSANRAFKCPYCPKESTLQMCMELHLN